MLPLLPICTHMRCVARFDRSDRYAGGVTKGFALIAGILVTGLAEFVVDGTPMGSRHAVSTALVCTAIYLHNTFQYRPPAAAAATAAAAAKQKKKN